MIRGQITSDLEAVIPLRVLGSNGLAASIDAVIDTGFTGYLTLPTDSVEYLRLALVQTDDYILADGSIVAMPVYYASVGWDAGTRVVLALQTDAEPLIGMKMLRGHYLGMEIADGGLVSIEDLIRTY